MPSILSKAVSLLVGDKPGDADWLKMPSSSKNRPLKQLTASAVPAIVRRFVDVWLELLPDVLHGAAVMRIGRANHIGVTGVYGVCHLAKGDVCFVDVVLRVASELGGFLSNFVAMLVGADLVAHLAIILTLIARPDVSQHIVERVADVRLSINIGDSGRDI
jgi:hypothetical protein